ncbi:dTDP-4-dehydrorhamnose 3,5-epimerase [Aneurinibacillus soli]|uniref:dTDP-4-dehydrorhamnose 3,5-epimerase n=1 Tax=Aneurinibacillus soli TaxID=1500254 RepID=A0A0U5B4C4_9BACL|nr:dTDP-4-dehydrorhamnose 3,5-epimerase [Aneurinibacillus soli]PYE61527.1 dTDP-4-dehydrorhamnose 3,5-epimerase [Aneurinibacillus soli]BAU26518.1 dTDP-4-dehydrorhamnose 3,5-epimerase [Aneurinibacillus soli]
MNIKRTRFAGVYVLEPAVFGDARGYFMESYNQRVFHELGIHTAFIQDNQSLSRETGVLRGLHYQLHPKAQTKLIRVLSGVIYDAVVDIRHGSPTFGQWEAFILSEDNRRQLLVPQGFAHGFCTLVPDTLVFYKVDEYYSPEHDRGIAWDDPALGIPWPTSNPILSEKDKHHPVLAEAEIHVE